MGSTTKRCTESGRTTRITQHEGKKAAGEPDDEPGPPGSDRGIGGEREQHRKQGRGPERPARDMDRRVAGAEHGARRLAQKTVAVQDVPRCPGEQEEQGVGEEVIEHRAWRHDPDAQAIADQPGAAVGEEQQRRRRQSEHRHRLLDPLERRKVEQIERDVATVEGLGLAERLCPDEADELVPALGEAEADDDRRDERREQLERADQAARRHAGDLTHRTCRRERADQIDAAHEQPEIAPAVEEHDQGGRGEECQPDESRRQNTCE